MDEETYWALVEQARAAARDDSADAVAAAMVDRLSQRPPGEIIAAQRAYERVSARGYRWSLWGAAYLINGGASDDGFDYFRGWLVTRGRAAFEAALADPDSLADLLAGEDLEEAECEDMLGAAWDAYRRATRHDIPDDGTVNPLPDLGVGWDFDDDAEMERRYPRLFALVSEEA